jgi:hypothetical protein
MAADVRALPGRNKLVLGVTSLWMLLPVAHGACGVMTSGKACVLAALACACVSSVLFWSDARRGSLMHTVDRGCAALYVACVVLVSVRGGGERPVRAELQALLATAMLGLFVAGDVFFKRRRYDHQLAFHLLFRWVA